MLTIHQTNKLEEYAKLKQEIKKLELVAEELNPEVLEIMRIQDVEEIELEGQGKITLGERRNWKYSQDVQNAEKYLKEKKQIEERTGKADCTIKKFVRFTTIGDKED